MSEVMSEVPLQSTFSHPNLLNESEFIEIGRARETEHRDSAESRRGESVIIMDRNMATTRALPGRQAGLSTGVPHSQENAPP